MTIIILNLGRLQIIIYLGLATCPRIRQVVEIICKMGPIGLYLKLAWSKVNTSSSRIMLIPVIGKLARVAR